MSKEELIKKIKALADRGVGGEKENAQKLLKSLMLKYNISEEELDEEVIKEFYITVPKFYRSMDLIYQVLYSVVGENCRNMLWRRGRKRFLKCTTAEFLEFEAKFKFYFYHYKKEIDRYYSAFIQANEIFPSLEKANRSSKSELTEEDKKMLKLASSLEKHDYRLQLDGGKKWQMN